jgi:hypothetical protein
MQTLASSVDRASYVIANSNKEAAMIWRKTLFLLAAIGAGTLVVVVLFIALLIKYFL